MIAQFEKQMQHSMFTRYRDEDNLRKAADVVSAVIPADTINVGDWQFELITITLDAE